MGITAALLAGVRAAGADTHELFVGNSITATNDLPAMVGQLRSVSGAPMDYSQGAATTFGVGLDWHWADASPQGAHALLAPGGWNGVVLQDLSPNATDNPNRTRTYVGLWNGEINQKSPDAVTYLFAHWQRQDRPDSQPIIDSLYTSIGADIDATVVPAGDAWARLQTTRPDIGLYVDVVHPTLRGSYTAAATFYASFYGQSPVGFAPPPGINAVDALAIQNAAWDVVSGRATALDRSWAGGAGDWNDANNWGPNGLPAAGDRISISGSDDVNQTINYVSPTGASTLLGSLSIGATNGAITIQQSQSTLRVAGNLVLGSNTGGSGNYVLSGTGRVFAARDEQVVNGSFTQHGGRHIVMQKLSVGGLEASYLLDGGLLEANMVEVTPGGTFTQLGGTLQTTTFNLAGGTVLGTLHNNGVFNYSSGSFHGKLINEGLALLFSNAGKISPTAGGVLPQIDIEISGDGPSLVRAGTNQDIRSLKVDYQNEGQQGFDLASGATAADFRTIRVYPADVSAIADAERGLGVAIANALTDPGDGIFDSGLIGRSGARIGMARRIDANQNPFLLLRPTVLGDLNLDGIVTISDFIDLAANFDSPNATWETGDLNYDGNVSISDFIDLAANFGRSYSGDVIPISTSDQRQLNAFAAANVPEPGGAIFMVVLSLAMAIRIRGSAAK